VNISLEEIFSELDKEITKVVPREPGDMDDVQLVKRYGCTLKTIRLKMEPHVKAGEFLLIWVRDPERGRIKVYRKVK
jgi:hypothetical protein